MCPIPEKRFLRNNLLDCVHDDVHGLSNKLSDDLRHRAPQHALLQNDHCDFHTWFLKLRHRNASHSQRDALADAKCQDHFDALLLNLRRGDILDDALLVSKSRQSPRSSHSSHSSLFHLWEKPVQPIPNRWNAHKTGTVTTTICTRATSNRNRNGTPSRPLQ